MITEELYQQYLKNEYKIIFSPGYSFKNEAIRKGGQPEELIYKAAKKAIYGWRNQKGTKAKKDVDKWLDEKGWVAVVLPDNLIALDVDSKDPVRRKMKFEAIKEICGRSSYGLHGTKNGYHFVFKAPCEYSASQDTMTKSGFIVTYRPSTRTNIIVEPTPDRSWIKFTDNENLSMLPDLLQPIDYKNIDEVRSALAMQLGYCYRSGILLGNDHIDMAFMHYLVVDCANDWETVSEFFQEIYVLDYEESKTKINFERVKNKDQKVLTIDTLLKVLHEKEMLNVIQLINRYGAAATDGKSSKFIDGGDEPDKKTTTRELAFKFAEAYAVSRNIFSYNKMLYQRGKDFVYAPFDSVYMVKDFVEFLGPKRYSSRLVEEMSAYIKQKKVMSMPKASQDILMKNGKVFNLKSFQTREPVDSDIFYHKANCSYDSSAKCPRFIQFLNEIFPENTEMYIDFLRRYIGIIFCPQLKFEIALIFRGEGANGKSVLMDVIEQIIGENNVTHIPLSKLKDEKYSVTLMNSLLNMHAEIESRIVVDDDVIKTLISGETVMARNPYEKVTTFKPVCKFIYASNNAVTSLDKSAGYERRIMFIDFLVNFDAMPEKKDVNLRKKLYAEMDGIFTWAIDGAKEVLDVGKLLIPDVLFAKSKNEHKINNPIYEFASEHLIWSLQEDAKTKIDDIYKEFRLFCDMNGYKASNKKNFSQNLRRVVPDLINLQVKINRSKRGFKSVWLLPTYYNKRTGEITADVEQRVINESCEKHVTETTYKEYLDWRKALKEASQNV